LGSTEQHNENSRDGNTRDEENEQHNQHQNASARFSPQLRDLIAMDLRGHGQSAYASSYEPKYIAHDLYQFRREKYRRELEELLRAQEDNKGNTSHTTVDSKSIDALPQAIVMGMSLGGLSTLDHWIRYGTSLGGIIVDITPDNGRQRNEGMIALQGMKKSSLDEWVAWAREFNPHRSEESLKKRLQYSVGPNENGEWVWRTDPKFGLLFEKDTSDPHYWNWMWDELKKLRPSTDQTQVLIVRGGRSNVTKPEEVDKLVKIMNEGADREWVRSIEIENAGHSVQGDAPVEFYNAVCDHLRRIYSSRQKL